MRTLLRLIKRVMRKRDVTFVLTHWAPSQYKSAILLVGGIHNGILPTSKTVSLYLDDPLELRLLYSPAQMRSEAVAQHWSRP